jgi:hypothetical protein
MCHVEYTFMGLVVEAESVTAVSALESDCGRSRRLWNGGVPLALQTAFSSTTVVCNLELTDLRWL